MMGWHDLQCIYIANNVTSYVTGITPGPAIHNNTSCVCMPTRIEYRITLLEDWRGADGIDARA
jgi:hypothetical protein